MSRPALMPGFATLLVIVSTTALGLDPHLDPALVPGGCNACHEGHGMSRSPMLPSAQVDVCLTCHGTATSRNIAVKDGILSPTARPQLLSSVLSEPSLHPLSKNAYSRREPGVVTCTSCHAPHRSSSRSPLRTTSEGGQKSSPRHESEPESDLCNSCHGGAALGKRAPSGISERFDPRNRSSHPVEVPAREASPSLLAGLSGGRINCTDCHGNSDAAGIRGPHGSAVQSLLRAEYTRIDGTAESAAGYALCYRCHDRERVLDSRSFPEHRRHVVEQRTACATCHDPHGSVGSPALIRFGESRPSAEVSLSLATGLLAFESPAPGEGTCYLTCHGYDHAPASYSAASTDFRTKSGEVAAPLSQEAPTRQRKQRSVPDRVR